MQKQYVWAILALVASFLIYIIFKPIERTFTLRGIIHSHAHATHYYFADPKCLARTYPDIVESAKLIDGRVVGRDMEAVEVYDIAVNTHIKFLGFHNFTTILTADVHSRSSFYHTPYIRNFMSMNIHWRVAETGDSRMDSSVQQDVTICLPQLFWAFITETHEAEFSEHLKTGIKNAEDYLQSHPN